MPILPALLLALAPARGADDAQAQLVGAYATRPVRADWLFVLETGGESKAAADASRKDIAAFVEAVPAGDTVEIIGWHTRASVALPNTRVEDAGRAALVEQIRTLEFASAKDRDLGAALSAAASTLDRPGAGDVQFLFFTSNFCHAPTFASDWDSGGRGCRAVRGLEKLGKGFGADRGDDGPLLVATLFPMATPSDPVHEPGVDAARSVFDGAGDVGVSEKPLGAWLAEHGPQVAFTRVLPLAQADAARLHLTASVVTPPTPTSPRATLSLATGLRDLGLRVDDLAVSGATSTATSPLELRPDGVFDVALPVAEPPFSFFPRSETLEFDVVVRGDGTLQPDAGLRAAGLDPAHPGLEVHVPITLTRSYGVSVPLALLVYGGGGMALLLGGVWLRGRLAPRRLGGAFVYRKGGGPRRVLDIHELDEAPIVVRPEGELGVGRPQDAVLVLRMARPFLRTHAEVEIRPSAEVEINTRRVAAGRHRIVAGATSFQFGDYRLTWE